MTPVEIPFSWFASYASVPLRGRDREAREIATRKKTDYDPAKDYWKQPREAIRQSVTYKRVADRLSRVEFVSSDKNRIANYEKAIDEFRSWLGMHTNGTLGSSDSASVSVEPFVVNVKPDLKLESGGHTYHVRVRFNKGRELLPAERLVTTSLIAEGFPESVPAILDVATGEFSTRRGSDREMLEKVAADLASRWPSQ